LVQILASVGVGTNLALYQVFFALLSGRFLGSRGALVPALDNCGLSEAAVRRCVAAVAYGTWSITALLTAWQKCVLAEGRLRLHEYEGYRPIACDLVGFFRSRLEGQVGKHYTSKASKAIPAMVFAMVAAVGSVGKKRLPLLRTLMRQRPEETEAQLQKRAIQEAARTLQEKEVLVADAGFSHEDLQSTGKPYVIRLDQNVTARRNVLPKYKGKGAHPRYGEIVRPLSRTFKGKQHNGDKPSSTARWNVGKHTVKVWIFEDVVLANAAVGSPTFRIIVIFDPRYKKPLVLGTNLVKISVYAVWCLYHDRWPVEQMPLAAKQMLGCERMFVFSPQSRWRLPELAMLAGNILSYVAACNCAVATGFWDRNARPTCGRLRRVLARMSFSEFPLPSGQFRKKESPTAHLPKGVAAHRRQKSASAALRPLQKAA
jgi:hypothetical protein